MDFPDHCLRGISKGHIQNTLPELNKVSAVVFYPDESTSAYRLDSGTETSINWEDDDKALEFTLNQTKDDLPQFPGGAVRLSRTAIEYVNTRPGMQGSLSYERAPLPENQYHGNIVFRANLSKHVIKMIAAALAMESSQIIKKK
jgi:hypothetical protein